jgi:hypothetical protein
MSRKIDRALRGPSLVEVVLGAVFSLVIGVVLGAALLIFRPVTVVKELPKAEARDPNAIYFVEGSRENSRAREAAAKRKAFAEGQSISVIEDELNAQAGPATAFAPPANPAAAKKAADEAAASDQTIVIGTPNFRIREGKFQIGVPVTLNVSYIGFTEKVVVQTRGGFEKQGDAFVYQPDTFYVGCLPVQRIPILSRYARDQFLNSQPIPDEIKASWMKLASVSVEGNVLNLKMP